VDTPYTNLKMIPGTKGLLSTSKTSCTSLNDFRYDVRALDADVVIVDLDAGTRPENLDTYLMALATGLVLITPEKTSIDNAFKLVRAVFYHRIKQYY
jgi:flagellar biosynthesis protein FlhG